MNEHLNSITDTKSEQSKPSLEDTKALLSSMFGDEGEDDFTDSDSVDDNFEEQNVVLEANTNLADALQNNQPIPTVVTDTSVASDEPYIPLLPKAVQSDKKRQLILDTETTGLDALNGDRIIEIGVVEVVNRRFTGEKLHVYIDPQRDMDPEAIAVHGITPAFLVGKPKFADIAQQVYDFLIGGEIIAHNAPFDMGFLKAEFDRVQLKNFDKQVSVTDSLAVAKAKYPGQKNSLDALVKRLEILTKDRTFHGALLDAEILADVYLTMTGGQVKLGLGETTASLGAHKKYNHNFNLFKADTATEELHKQWLMQMADSMGNDEFLSVWGIQPELSIE